MKYQTQDLKSIKHKKVPIWLKISAILIFSALIIWSVVLVRNKMLKNANDMGMYLAQSYAWEEENKIETYSMLLSICSGYTNDKIDAHASDDEISFLLKDYSEKVGVILESSIIDPYAVINDKIVAANPWEGDEDYDYQSTEWYQKALSGNGEVIYTNVYKDAITGKNMVTLAVKLHGENNVLAFDMIIDNFKAHENSVIISEKFCYMLYGADDKVIYSTGYSSSHTESQQQFANDIVEQIRSGQMISHDATVIDPDGFSRAVYYYEMSNGWLAVITIPVAQILQDGWNDVIVGLAMLCVLIIGGIIIFMLKSYLVNQNVKYTIDTLKLLGDSYYEIYRVNYITGIYKAIKVPDDIKNQDAEDYSQLVDVIKSKIEEDYASQFKNDFSIENIRELISNGVFEFQRQYKRKFDDKYKWISAQVIYKSDIQKNQVVICFKNIDDQKKYELNQNVLLKNALDAAQNNIKQKTTFFSTISHDMRTPLSAIIGLSKLAHAKKDDREKVDEYVCKIQSAGEQMLSFVNNVLELSRIESTKNSINYTPIDINKSISNSLQILKSKINDKTINFISDIVHPYVYGDAIKLAQILNNLVNNAIKYTNPNDTITVSLKETNGEDGFGKYIICVEDTGVGMSEETKKNAFELCNRQNSLEKGLGLPIVKMLVHQMNGEIYLESELSKGSKFTVVLPMQITDKFEIEKRQADNNEKLDKLRNKYILLAEDNQLDAEYIIKYLESLGTNVLHVKNGREAVNLYTKKYQQISIILMDLKMPVLDGFSACLEIRELPFDNAKNVPIIAVTAHISDDDITHMSASGISTYVNKPINCNQLEQVILDYMNRNI